MAIRSEDDLGALWRDQSTAEVRLTAHELRTRAEQFESESCRRYLRDQVCFGLVAAICAYASFALDGGLVRLGYALLLIWALYCMYGLRRFGAVLQRPSEMTAQTCAVYHRRQLERQKDIVLSWPLGAGLAAPGFLIAAVGFAMGPRHLPWSATVALIGVGAFVYLAALLYGRILVGPWQREINSVLQMSTQTNDKSMSDAQ
jgi:hypothetical protein